LNTTSRMPNKNAYVPRIQTTERAPTPGYRMMSTPNRTVASPARPSNSSPSMTFRNLMAAAISNTPRTMAHAAMKYSSTIAVSPGYINVASPAPILMTPMRSDSQSLPPNPPNKATTPSARQ